MNLKMNLSGAHSHPQKNGGLTMIQVLVGIALFTIIMGVSMGAILGALDANRKAQSMQTAMNSLNFAMESMSRHIRFGSDYRCDKSGDCSDGDDEIKVNFRGDDITYQLSGGKLFRLSSKSVPSGFVTGDDTTIDNLKFYVTGTGDSDGEQPMVTIVMSGVAAEGRDYESDFHLQTSVSQRSPNR